MIGGSGEIRPNDERYEQIEGNVEKGNKEYKE